MYDGLEWNSIRVCIYSRIKKCDDSIFALQMSHTHNGEYVVPK